MTKNTRERENSGANRKATFGPPQFIKYRLTDVQLEAAKGSAENYSDVGEIVSQMIDEGYKFSASHDGWGGGVQVFMTTGDEKSVNFGYTLSARAPTLVNAVAVLCFKHYALFMQDWPKESDDAQKPNWG